MSTKALWVLLALAPAVLFLLTLEIEIKLILKNQKNYSFIVLRILKGLIRLRFNLSIQSGDKKPFFITLKKTDSPLKKTASPEEIIRFIQRGAAMYKDNKSFIQYIKSKIKVTSFSIMLRTGLDNAASAALLSGGLIVIFSSIIAYLNDKYHLKSSKMQILPCFGGYHLDVDLDCIITLKIGYIIIAGIKTMFDKIKGGESDGGAPH